MVAINFPAGAVALDLFTDAGKTWQYDGTAWNLTASPLQVEDISIDTANIVNNAVTSGKIADGTIVNSDISVTAAINATKITNWEDDQVVLSQRIFS